MLHWTMVLAGLLMAAGVQAAQDFNCMQSCYDQGYDRNYCISMCNTAPGYPGGGMLDQPGLPKNPALDQMRRDSRPQQQPLPPIADPQCVKDCQKHGYNYMFCRKQCSY